ncbi:hypothetical protein Q7P37_002497 [Cladosporium fusiforme]
MPDCMVGFWWVDVDLKGSTVRLVEVAAEAAWGVCVEASLPILAPSSTKRATRSSRSVADDLGGHQTTRPAKKHKTTHPSHPSAPPRAQSHLFASDVGPSSEPVAQDSTQKSQAEVEVKRNLLEQLRYKLVVKVIGKGLLPHGIPLNWFKTWKDVQGFEHVSALEHAIGWWDKIMGENWQVERIEAVASHGLGAQRSHYRSDLHKHERLRADWDPLLDFLIEGQKKDGRKFIAVQLTVHCEEVAPGPEPAQAFQQAPSRNDLISELRSRWACMDDSCFNFPGLCFVEEHGHWIIHHKDLPGWSDEIRAGTATIEHPSIPMSIKMDSVRQAERRENHRTVNLEWPSPSNSPVFMPQFFFGNGTSTAGQKMPTTIHIFIDGDVSPSVFMPQFFLGSNASTTIQGVPEISIRNLRNSDASTLEDMEEGSRNPYLSTPIRPIRQQDTVNQEVLDCFAWCAGEPSWRGRLKELDRLKFKFIAGNWPLRWIADVSEYELFEMGLYEWSETRLLEQHREMLTSCVKDWVYAKATRLSSPQTSAQLVYDCFAWCAERKLWRDNYPFDTLNQLRDALAEDGYALRDIPDLNEDEWLEEGLLTKNLMEENHLHIVTKNCIEAFVYERLALSRE